MKLTAKIMALLLFTVITFTWVASYFSIRASYDQFRKEQQELARRFGQELHDNLADAWRNHGLTGVVELLDELPVARQRGVSIRWVWFEPNAAAEQRPRGKPEHWAAVKNGQIVSIISADPGGRRQLHTYLPLKNDSGRLGGIEITDSLAGVESQARRTAWNAVLTVVGLALVCIGIAYLAGLKWVALPLDALIEKTRRIGEGDFSRPLTLSTNDELGQLAGALNQMCDRLTAQQERIRSESEKRMTAVEQLRHSDRLTTVGRLAAGLAHELGTPLNVVAGRAALIESGKLTGTDVTNSARVIKSEADRMTNIVRQLLDFARQSPPKRATADLDDLVRRTIGLIEPLAMKKSIAIGVDSPPERINVFVDAAQFQQVLTNIVINAIQVMSPDGQIRVILSSDDESANGESEAAHNADSNRRQHLACVSVEDQGPGIPAELRDSIFEPFFTTKDVGEGTGLGLSIADSIVREHGGRIQVVDLPGRGTRFDIYLPQENPA